MSDQSDLWAWAREEAPVEAREVDAKSVLAVLVAHNGAQWLPRVLLSLATLTTQCGKIVAVDAQSTDDTAKILAKAESDGLLTVLAGQADKSYGANVALAIEEYGADFDWFWLLHDDSSPDSEALRELLLAADKPELDGEKPAILVPKLLQPKRRNHPDQMSAAGQSITATGLRVVTVEAGDIDQQQLEPTRVLGASTAGLLIRKTAWQQLGGIDDSVGLFRDGVELGWRANAAGLVVRTAPKAALRHVQAGRVGFRDSTLAPDPVFADLLAGMRVAVLHSPDPAKTISKISHAARLRAAGYLLGKSLSMARAQLAAAKQLRAESASLIAKAKQLQADGDKTPAQVLPAKSWAWRRFFDDLAGGLSDRHHDLTETYTDATGMIDELTGDDFAGAGEQGRKHSAPIIALLLLSMLLVAASRNLFGLGQLHGPMLYQAIDSVPAAWTNWLASQPNQLAANPPWLAIMALGSTLFFGNGDLFVSIALLASPIFAFWTCYRLLRPTIGKGYLTMLFGLTWALTLPMLGLIQRGDLASCWIAVALPSLAGLARRWRFAPISGAAGLRVPAMIALWSCFITALAPLTCLIGAGVAVAIGWQRRHDIRGALLVLLAPFVVWAPWLPAFISEPGRLLTAIDPAAQLAGPAPRLLGSLTGGPWLPAVSLAIIWLVGLIGTLAKPRIGTRASAVFLILATLATPIALFVHKLVVPVAGVQVRPNLSWLILAACLAWLLLAAYGLERNQDLLSRIENSTEAPEKHRETRRLLAILFSLSALLASGYFAAATVWPLTRSPEKLPSYLVAVQTSPRATRSLLIQIQNGVANFNLVSAAGPSWGSGERAVSLGDVTADADLAQVTQQFAQGQPSDDLAKRLGQLAIGHVWIADASKEQIDRLTGTPGLSLAVNDDQSITFIVDSLPSQLAVYLPASGSSEFLPDQLVGQRPKDALLLLSQPADAGWQVSVDGKPLAKAKSPDWRAAFQLDGNTGQISISQPMDWPATSWQLVAILLLIILAAPTAHKVVTPRRAVTLRNKEVSHD